MIVAFDIDGTLSNGSHRDHLAKSGQWDEFHALCHLDKPYQAAVSVLQALGAAGHLIEIWTARPDSVQVPTELWLAKHSIPYDGLLMRKHGDWRRAYIVKLEWYLRREPAGRPALVFEDHPETTRLLRDAGAQVYQVNEGRSG